MSDTTKTSNPIPYSDDYGRFYNESGEICYDEIDYESLTLEEYLFLSYEFDRVHHYVAKPNHLKVDNIKRKFNWEKANSKFDSDDINHRRFNVTLQSTQITKSFKKCVQRNEINREELLTVIRVCIQKLLQNPETEDKEVVQLHSMIRKRVETIYEKKLKERRNRIK